LTRRLLSRNRTSRIRRGSSGIPGWWFQRRDFCDTLGLFEGS
jgi:hypothetical protein